MFFKNSASKRAFSLACILCLTSSISPAGRPKAPLPAVQPSVAQLKEHCVKIGDKAPPFKARSTRGTINFPADFKGQWIIFFSHPADFTPVCTTEFKRLAQMADEFKKMNTALVGLSVDSVFTHEIWMRDLEKQLTREGKRKRNVNFPVVADRHKKIALQYGMIHPNESKEQTVRAIFFIDPEGVVCAELFYPISNGRSFNEVKRLLEALQITYEKDVATPADWQPGKPTISKEKAERDILPD